MTLRSRATTLLAMAILSVATLSVGFINASPAGAIVEEAGNYAGATAGCALPGLVAYDGVGFSLMRVSTYTQGRGWLSGRWQTFQRSGTGDPQFTSAPQHQGARTFATYIEYRFQHPVTRQWITKGEWLLNEYGSYWCRAR